MGLFFHDMHCATLTSRLHLACIHPLHTIRHTSTVVPANNSTAAQRRQQLAATMTENYSIWIKPSGHLYKKLQQEITTQAKEFGAPLFEPHVTLLPDIQGEKEQIIATMQQLAQDVKVSCKVFGERL
jgi:hypothetical protein